MKRDQGFSVAELVVAVAILFFVLTALFGLVGASTGLSASAKQRALAVDTGSSFIEDIRTLQYEQVGVVGAPSGEPTGTIPSTTTLTRNNMTITITPVVTWVPDPKLTDYRDYKKVVLTIVVTRVTGNPYTYTVTTYVRNRSTNPDSPGPPKRPTIQFTDYTPADGSVIYGQSVPVGATAGHESPDGILTVLRMVGGTGLVRSTGGLRAEWGINAHTFATTPSPFLWDTTLTYTEETSAGPVTRYNYPDGPITLVAQVLDTQNYPSFVTRNYIIDNAPPDAPANPVISTPTPPTTPLRLTWAPGQDGSVPAPSHRVVLYTQGSADTQTDVTQWGAQSPVIVTTPEGNPTTIAYDYSGAAPFSRYAFSVVALSARSTPSLSAVSGPFTTRPRLAGTAGTSGSSATHNLTVTAPSFPCVGNVTYAWYVSVNGGTWSATSPATTTTNALTRTGLDKNSVYRYRARVTYTPAGPGSVSTYAYTQTAGQTNKGQSNFTAVDDWTQWW